MKRALCAMAVGAALLATVACQPSRDDRGLARLLELVPDDDGTAAYVALADWERARSSVGLGRAADDEAAVAQLVQLSQDDAGPQLVAAGFDATALRDPDQWREEYGFTVRDVDASFEAGAPPGRLQGAVLTDTAPIEEALRSDPVWREQLETVPYGDVAYYRWGEDGRIDPARVSAPRPLGMGGRLLVLDDERLVVRAARDGDIESAIDARDATSLADDDAVRRLVEALDGAGMASIYLTSQLDALDVGTRAGGTGTGATDGSDEPGGAAGAGVPVAEVVGGGHGIVDGEGIMIWAAVYRTGTEATAAAPVVQRLLAEGRSFVSNRPLRDLVQVRSVEVRGPMVVATLTPTAPTGLRALWTMLTARDVLFSRAG